jgi:hypothetical protein
MINLFQSIGYAYVKNVLGNEWQPSRTYEKIMKFDPVMEGLEWRLINK